MKPHLALAFLALVSAVGAAENPPGIPADYKLLYQQDFKSAEAMNDFVFTDVKAWKITSGDKQALELAGKSDYKPPFRSPVNIALLKGKAFEDFIIEADCLQTGKEYGHRDMVFFYGYQSPSRFYYTHIATSADNNAHNCFIVNEAARVKFGHEVTKGVNWGLGVWHHVRLERKASDGTVRVFFDDMANPIMTAEDKTFGAGAVGFGSFDDTGKIANVKIWGKAVQERETAPFAGK
jgi:hypothetical protein